MKSGNNIQRNKRVKDENFLQHTNWIFNSVIRTEWFQITINPGMENNSWKLRIMV